MFGKAASSNKQKVVKKDSKPLPPNQQKMMKKTGKAKQDELQDQYFPHLYVSRRGPPGLNCYYFGYERERKKWRISYYGRVISQLSSLRSSVNLFGEYFSTHKWRSIGFCLPSESFPTLGAFSFSRSALGSSESNNGCEGSSASSLIAR